MFSFFSQGPSSIIRRGHVIHIISVSVTVFDYDSAERAPQLALDPDTYTIAQRTEHLNSVVSSADEEREQLAELCDGSDAGCGET